MKLYNREHRPCPMFVSFTRIGPGDCAARCPMRAPWRQYIDGPFHLQSVPFVCLSLLSPDDGAMLDETHSLCRTLDLIYVTHVFYVI